MCLGSMGAVLGAGAFLAPVITLPASAEALARSSATRKLTLGPLLVATGVVVVGKEAVVPMVVSGVRRGRVVARVDGTGNQVRVTNVLTKHHIKRQG